MKIFRAACFGAILGWAILCAGIAQAWNYGPATAGSYQAVTVSVTSVASTTPTLVGASASDRSLAVITNVGATYDLYWGEGASAAAVNTWHKLPAGSSATIYTCNWASGTWGKTNSGVYVRVTPTPWTEAMADFRSYKLLR